LRDLSAIVHAYDVRGVVPDELDTDDAREVGRAFVHLLSARTVVTAHDMRASSVPLSRAFAEGATGQGADVIEAGLGSTDLLYFASGSLAVAGAMFTASHNPARYGGIKLCRPGAAPVGQSSGLREIAALVAAGVPDFHGSPGQVTTRDLLREYGEHLRSLVDLRGSRPLSVVIDAGNGMAGLTAPAVFDGLPLSIDPLYFELDGTFPNHEANPIEPENVADLQARVREVGADVGLAFDGDADRCFVVDERGEIVSPSAITALIATRELARRPGARIIHNLITSRAVPEIVREHGGVPVRTQVGHSYIKERMAATGAVFGGEHSGHFYFADFWRADSGMLAALHTLAALGSSPGPLSELVASYSRYAASGEVNSSVPDVAARMARVEHVFGARKDARIDHLDGLTVELTGGSWFNLRPSNTEPLLRLNVEGSDPATMAELRDHVLALVRGGGIDVAGAASVGAPRSPGDAAPDRGRVGA